MLTALLATHLVLAPAVAKLDVYVETRRVGEVVWEEKKLDGGGKSTVLVMTMQVDGASARVRQETVVDSTGRATRKINELVNGKARRLVVAELSPKGANLTITEDGKMSQKFVPVSEKVPLENPSEFWFRPTVPKVGSKAVYYNFDMSELTWRLEETLYEGKGTREAGGKKFTGHLLTSRRGKIVMDEEGLPILLESEGLRMQKSNR